MRPGRDRFGGIRLVRPWNGALAGAAVLLGGWLGGAPPREPALLRMALATALIASAGYVLNDLKDLARDRVNHPRRPLATGAVRAGTARVVLVLLAAAGLAFAVSAGRGAALLALAWIAALLAYEHGLKERQAWGNLVVSAVSASAFLAGGLAAPAAAPAMVPAGFAFLYHFARELWKDAADVEGDRATGARTVAASRGEAGGLRAACLVFGLVVLLTPVPYFAGLYNRTYLALALGGVDLLLLIVMALALLHPTRLVASRTQGVLKLGMALGMCAIALGRVS